MTGCEIVIVLTMLYRPDGTYRAIRTTPIIPKKCRVHVRFRAEPPVRLLLCPVPARK